MTDARGWRRLFGVLGPSTNTIVQPDFDDLRPHGVTNHYSRIFTPDSQAVSNETFMAGTQKIAENVVDAVDAVMTCHPDYLVMGMSAITFYGGVKGTEAFEKKVTDASQVGVSTGATATRIALETYGAKRIAFFSPYFPAANEEVRRYYQESGFTVVRDDCLRCPSWTRIAHVTTDKCRETILALDGDDIDAIVQVGTNLSMIRLAAAAELFLGKPVIAINTATYWHALRQNDIQDKISGFGRLLEDF